MTYIKSDITHAITRMLTLSTAHIAKETAQMMDQMYDGKVIPGGHPVSYLCFDAVEYGYLVWANADDETIKRYPQEIAEAVRLAKANDCTYIRYDCDALTVEGLPTYDW